MKRVAVVGGGVAAARASEYLLHGRTVCSVVVVKPEKDPGVCYRPALSKQVLTGEWPISKAFQSVSNSDDVEVHSGEPAVALDCSAGSITLGNGKAVAFDALVIATGASPRRLVEPCPARGVFELRTVQDAVSLRHTLPNSRQVVIVGAGFIGCEVATACARIGIPVKVIDPEPYPMSRVLGNKVGRWLLDEATKTGISLHLGNSFQDLVFRSGRVFGVMLQDGSFIDADTVVFGLGVEPNTRWLTGSGIQLDNGVLCDGRGLALGTDNVFAAGDVANWYLPSYGKHIRLEHWFNAMDQARLTASGIRATAAGSRPDAEATAVQPVPYFWSDVFGHKLQVLGIPDGAAPEPVEEECNAKGFVMAYGGSGSRSPAYLCVDRPDRTARFRRLLSEGQQCEGRLLEQVS